MAEKIHPSAKPAAPLPAAFPATKAQMYNASRPAYRPQPPPRRRSRCCSCFCWTILVIIVILILSAITGAVFYLLYSPHKPYFIVSNVEFSHFNLTSKSVLASDLNVSVLARNPNKKIKFLYSSSSVGVTVAGVHAGDGMFPEFMHPTKNTTVLNTRVVSTSKVDEENAMKFRNQMKSKKKLTVKIEINTKVRVKIGNMKTKRVHIRVACGGIKVAVPSGKKGSVATTSGDKCKVDLRVKIWKWTF